MDFWFVLSLNCLVLKILFLSIANLSENFKPVIPGFSPPKVFWWISVVDKSMLSFLIIERLEYLETLSFLTYSNINDAFKSLSFVFVFENFSL